MNHEFIIFTDLDGTLLDHDTYSYAGAGPALALIRQRKLPLVLCSSKTAAELKLLHRELSLDAPFICENGAAIYAPTAEGWRIESLAEDRAGVLSALRSLRAEGFGFTGFSDCDNEQIAELTGLNHDGAALAAAREFSEPLIWQDDPQNIQHFIGKLEARGLVAQQGGRFLTISGRTNKGQALRKVMEQLCPYQTATVIALGDSPNDESMLAEADIAVIVRSARSGEISLSGPQRVVRTSEAGPSGWNRSVLQILGTDLAP